MAFDGIDAETLAVIIELQLSDLGSLIKGKGKEGDETPDGEIAMSAYKEELDCLECFRADRALCQSIARAVELDGDTIASHVDIKEQAADDRQQALDTDQYVDDTLDTDPDQPNTNNNPSTIAEAMAVDHDDEDTVAESSAWAASRPGTSPSHGEVECVACCEMVPSSRIVRCPCSHEYCLDCVAQVFRGSIADESLFPPRCCKLPIPIGPNQGHLPEDVVTAFKTKAVEYNTQNRTYCHQMACSKFIHEASIDGDTATCQGCLSRTCTICKGPSHSDECPADTATQEVLRIAADNGWKRCHKCQRVVELDVGCNHMGKKHLPPFPNFSNTANGSQCAAAAHSSATAAASRGRAADATSGSKSG